MKRNRVVLVSALTAAALGAAGLAALALPAGAGTQPNLPEVSATDLLSSVMSVRPPAMAGTIVVDNALGLPVLPGLPSQIGNGSSKIRVWYDGDDRSRLSLPAGDGEKTMVDDGTTVWTWDSSGRDVTKVTPDRTDEPNSGPGRIADPTTAARQVLAMVEPTSEISVDGTATVADRPAYELVVSPKPTERTLLREVRVAVDSETRLPLRLEVLANGSDDPVLSVGFDSVQFGQQPDDLFRFTPPAGATVTEQDAGSHDRAGTANKTDMGPFGELSPTVVGDGWDTVLVATLPDDLLGGSASPDQSTDKRPQDKDWRRGPSGGGFDAQSLLDRIGTAVDGPWGSGRLISTTVVSVIITDDGRIAAGAVPQQVLVEALAR